MMRAPALINKIIETNPCYADLLESQGKIYTFLNPVSYLEALKNKELFEKFDGIFSDGKILARSICLFYHKRVDRCSFDMTSLASEFFRYSELHNKSIYFVASKQEELDRAMRILGKVYPKLNLAGARNGFFRNDQERDDEIKKIVSLNPDYVICGMGIFLQEKFLVCLKSAGFKGIGFTCGGFVSQASKASLNYYPRFFDKLNIRFMYRFLKEKHTRKRYLHALFIFPIKFVGEWMKMHGKEKFVYGGK